MSMLVKQPTDKTKKQNPEWNLRNNLRQNFVNQLYLSQSFLPSFLVIIFSFCHKFGKNSKNGNPKRREPDYGFLYLENLGIFICFAFHLVCSYSYLYYYMIYTHSSSNFYYLLQRIVWNQESQIFSLIVHHIQDTAPSAVWTVLKRHCKQQTQELLITYRTASQEPTVCYFNVPCRQHQLCY